MVDYALAVGRGELTDKAWAAIEPLLPTPGTRSGRWRDHRQVINGILWKLRTGAPWRDLPERYGPWKTVYNRFANWAQKGHWATIFRELQIEVDQTGSIVDGSVVRAHQDASGGKGGSDAMLWATLEEAFRPSSTPSSTRRRGRSTSR